MSNNWQDISTAPKDGTPILAWDGRAHLCVEFRQFKDGTAIWEVGKESGEGREKYIPRRGLTHWMPLPAPPGKPS